MKNFLKIFGICFGSMIGIFGATFGAFHLFGYWDVPKIYPENISFEITESDNTTFLLNDDIWTTDSFYITITTTTENVTMTEIELDLEGTGVDELENTGKISDGHIIIPSKVKIGEKFLVEPAKSNQELGFGNNKTFREWIIGGHSTIVARSLDNLELRPQSIDVHVDVPVYEIKTTAYATQTDATQNTEFSIGSNFKISADFSPANSKYYFSMNGEQDTTEILKNIYVSSNVNERDFVVRISDENLKQNIFTSLKETTTDGVNLTAYTFTNSKQQHDAEREYLDVNEITQTYSDDQIYSLILNNLMSGDYIGIAKKNTANLEFKKLTDLSYSMTTDTEESYKVNQTFEWFVNYNSGSSLSKNLEIEFASLSSNIDVQSEVQKLGVQILKSNGETYNYDSKLKPYNYGDVKYLAYYQITNGNDYLTFEEYDALSSEEKTPYAISYISEIDYNALLDAERSSYNEILIGEAEYDALSDNSVKNTFTAFYFVQLHNTNVDLSSWKFNFESANSYRIRFKFFSTDSSITIADKYVDVTVLANISLPVDFTNIDPIKLTIDYTKAEGEGPQEPEEPENPQEPQEPAVQNSVYNADVKEYNVSIYNSQSNINIPEENEYTDVRYFVFVDKVVEEDETTGIGDLTQYINAIKTNNKRELGGNFVNLYEIENGILKFKADNLDKIKDVTFYVSFATVKKDINGSIIYTYEDDVYSYDIDQHSSRYIQVSIIDTLKDVEVSATVDEDRLDVDFFEIKDVQNDSSYYAFLQNKQNVINVEIKAVDENQIELLKEEITNGNIQIVARSGQSNVTDQILSIVKQNGDEEDTSVKFNISTKLLTGSDQKFALFVVYTRNNKNYDVKIGEISVYEVFSGKATEVHFGKEVVSGEGEEQTTTNFGELIQAERQNSNPIKVTVSFSEGLEGTTITTSYKLVKNGEDVIGEDLLKSFLFDKDGNLIFTFNDKYGRQVESGTFSLESSNTEVMTVSENNIAFLKAGQCELRLIINEEIKDVLLFEYEENSAELSSIKVNSQNGLEDVFDITTQEEYDYSNNIETKFLGVKDAEIPFVKGAQGDGLLELFYRQFNPEYVNDPQTQTEFTYFDFSKQIKYTFETPLESNDDLTEMLEISYETDTNNIEKIKIINDFVSSARIQIKARIDILNLEQIIEIVIEPNVEVSATAEYEFNDAKNITDGANTYTGVYGSTTLNITIMASFVEDSASYSFQDQAGNALTKQENKYVYTYTFEQVNDYKKITLNINDGIKNKYRYNLDLHYYINPNIKVNTINSVNQNGDNEISLFADENIDNAIKITKITDDSIYEADKLTVLGEIVNGNYVQLSNSTAFTFANNKLTLANSVSVPTKLKLVLGSKLNTTDTNYKNIESGCKVITIGNVDYYYVEIEILPFIQYDLTSSSFIEYDGITFLKLISGTTNADKVYTFEELANCFKAEGYTISIEGVEQNLISTFFDVNNQEIIVREIYNIKGITDSYKLKVKAVKDASEHTLSVPVIFLPMEVPYLKAEYLNAQTTDLKNTLSTVWLKNNNAVLDLEIVAGEKINLDKIFAETFNLNDYSYSVINEDNTSNVYARVVREESEIDGNQIYVYNLETKLIDSNKTIVLVARRKTLGSSSASVIEIPVRIQLTNGLDLNVYYPYGGDKEYITLNNNLEIDLEKALDSYTPNKSSNNTRFELVNKDSNNQDVEILTSYSYEYSFRVENASEASNSSKYASLVGSKLTLKKVNEEDYSVIITISVLNEQGLVVLTKDYEIEVIARKTFALIPNAWSCEIKENESIDLTGTAGFELKEQKGQLTINATEQLKFYVANSQNVAKAIYEDNKWTLVAYDTVVDINAELVAYTAYGEIARFNVLIKTNSLIKLDGEFTADKEHQIILDIDGNKHIDIVKSITLNYLQKDDTKVGYVEDNVAYYRDNFNNLSQISINLKEDKYYLNVSPLSEDLVLNLSIEFEYNGQTAIWTTNVNIAHDLVSYINSVENAISNEINAGEDISVDLTTLFDRANFNEDNYDLSVVAVQNSQLVEIDGNNVRVKNSAVGGEVVLKYNYTHKTYSNYVVSSFVKYSVKKNVIVNINYPYGMDKEYLPSGSKIKLTDTNIFEQTRVEIKQPSEPGFSQSMRVVSYSVDIADGVDYVINDSKITLTLKETYSIGEIAINILYGEDKVANYYIEVRKTWNDIFKSTLLNIDGSTNSEMDPEIYLNQKNKEDDIKLNVADYASDDDDFIKKLVLGYAEDTLGNITFGTKSTFVYYIDNSKQFDLDNALIEFNDTVNKDIKADNYNIINIEIKFNGITICTYYAKFEFKVEFAKTEYTINANQKTTVKDMFGIVCNENYEITLAEDGGNIDYSILEYENGEFTKDGNNTYKGLDCLTFENNKSNPTVAGWGAPNNGLLFIYKVVVSFGDTFSVEKEVKTYIYPNYIVEHDSQLVVTDDMFTEGVYKFVASNSNINDSIIKVYATGSEENLLVKNRSKWTIISSNDHVVKTSEIPTTANTPVSFDIYQSTFGIKETKITFTDKYNYTFDYLIQVIPNQINIPKFKESALLAYENDTLVLQDSIANSSKIKLDSEKSMVNLVIEGMKEISQKGSAVLSAFVLPYVNDTKTGTLYVTIFDSTETDSTVLSIPITIRKKYSLSINEKYLKDGIVYAQEGSDLSVYDLYYILDNQTGRKAGERELIDTYSLYLASDKENDYLKQLAQVALVQINKEDEVLKLSDVILTEGTNINSGVTKINLTNLLEAKSTSTGILDATNYDYIVKLKYADDTDYTTINIYGNSANEIVADGDQYLVIGNYDNEVDADAKISIIAISNKNEYNLNTIYDFVNYTIDDTVFEAYVPFTRINGFTTENVDNYAYYILDTVIDFGIVNEKDVIINIKEDKVFKMSTGNNGDSVNVKFNETTSISVVQDGSIYEQSLLKLLNLTDVSNLTLFNGIVSGELYINGISHTSLGTIKGFSVSSSTEDISLENGKLNPSIEKGLNYSSYPYYEQSQIDFTIKFGEKEFDSSIVLRTIPPVVYIADVDYNVSWNNENDKQQVRVGQVAIVSNGVSFTEWASKVCILDEDYEYVSTLNELTLDSTWTISYKVLEEDSAKASINDKTGDITLKTFDKTSEHITIIINISKGEIYNFDIAEIVIVPRTI